MHSVLIRTPKIPYPDEAVAVRMLGIDKTGLRWHGGKNRFRPIGGGAVVSKRP